MSFKQCLQAADRLAEKFESCFCALFCESLLVTNLFLCDVFQVWDLDKIDASDSFDVTVYECPIDTVVCAPDKRLVFVKNYNKGYQYVDIFGIDIWNISTGNSATFLPVGRYGKLIQMEVSKNSSSSSSSWLVRVIAVVKRALVYQMYDSIVGLIYRCDSDPTSATYRLSSDAKVFSASR